MSNPIIIYYPLQNWYGYYIGLTERWNIIYLVEWWFSNKYHDEEKFSIDIFPDAEKKYKIQIIPLAIAASKLPDIKCRMGWFVSRLSTWSLHPLIWCSINLLPILLFLLFIYHHSRVLYVLVFTVCSFMYILSIYWSKLKWQSVEISIKVLKCG